VVYRSLQRILLLGVLSTSVLLPEHVGMPIARTHAAPAPQPAPALSAQVHPQQSSAVSPAQAEQQPISSQKCSAELSPFGNTITLGADKEIVVSGLGDNVLAADNDGMMVFDSYNGQRAKDPTYGDWRYSLDHVSGPIETERRDRNIRSFGTAAVDLFGDKRGVIARALVNATGQSKIQLQFDEFSVVWTDPDPATLDQTIIAVQAGDVITDEEPGKFDEEFVVASRLKGGELRLDLFNGLLNNAFGHRRIATITTNEKLDASIGNSLVAMAVGDLDGDLAENEFALAYLNTNNELMLTLFKYGRPPSGPFEQPKPIALHQVASTRVAQSINFGVSVHLAIGSIDLDPQQELVLAYSERNNNEGDQALAQKLSINTFDYNINAASRLVLKNSYQDPDATFRNLRLAVGDLDLDTSDEVVVAYHNMRERTMSDGTVAKLGLAVRTFNAKPSVGQGVFYEYPGYYWDQNSTQPTHISLGVGDLHADGKAEIVTASLNDQGKLQVLQMNLDKMRSDDPTKVHPVLLLRAYDVRTTAHNRALQLDLGDRDNDSLISTWAPIDGDSDTLRCRESDEVRVSAAIYIPPHWPNIQKGVATRASYGASETSGVTEGSSTASSQGHTVSGYFGTGFTIKVPEVFEVEATARATVGNEWNKRNGSGSSTSSSRTTRYGFTGRQNHTIVFSNSEYHCYSYQMRLGNTPVGALRNCLIMGQSDSASDVIPWDVDYGAARKSSGWLPITRDWASIAMFQPSAHYRQSSTRAAQTSQHNNSAQAAADGGVNTPGTSMNSTARTTAERTPWWQVDLGSAQKITKLRVWASTVPGEELSNFSVFVSDVDLSTLPQSNDPAALKNVPGVYTYSFTPTIGYENGNGTPSSPVASFITRLQPQVGDNWPPITGRYVRVQLNDTGTARALNLGEVQVFGTDVVEPSAYPVKAYDPDGKYVMVTKGQGSTAQQVEEYVPGTDNWFMVVLYNPATQAYEERQMRGNMLWDGSAAGNKNKAVLGNTTIGSGNTFYNWSMSDVNTTAKIKSHTSSTTFRVGTQFDVKAKIGWGVLIGGGSYQFASGFFQDNNSTLSYGDGLEIGGGINSFPARVDGKEVAWPKACEYNINPFMYEISDFSNEGKKHTYIVKDYIVPAPIGQDTGGLDRKDLRLEQCRRGEPVSALLPPANLKAVATPNKAQLSWDAAPNNPQSYYVYRRFGNDTVLLARVPAGQTSFLDDKAPIGSVEYAVRTYRYGEQSLPIKEVVEVPGSPALPTTAVPTTATATSTTAVPTTATATSTTAVPTTATATSTTAVPTTATATSTTAVPTTATATSTTAVPTTATATSTTAVPSTATATSTTAVPTTATATSTTAVPSTATATSTTAVPTTATATSTTAVPTTATATSTTAVPTTATPTTAVPTNPPTPITPVAIRINAGGPALTLDGISWLADQFFSGGETFIPATIATPLYNDLRQSPSRAPRDVNYAIPVPAGTYLVRLHFIEHYWGVSKHTSKIFNKRVISAHIENQTVLKHYDVNAEAPPRTPVVKSVLVKVSDGTLNLRLRPHEDRVALAALEVLSPELGAAPVGALQVASSAKASKSEALAGRSIKNTVQVRLPAAPQGGEVRWWLNDAARQGTPGWLGQAISLDTKRLPNGLHTLTVEVVDSQARATLVYASFRVKN
jgi:hypothetical protein